MQDLVTREQMLEFVGVASLANAVLQARRRERRWRVTLLWIALLGALALGLGVFAWRSKREARRLRERLERAAVELENLQRSFSRFAPDDVIEKIIADGTADIGVKKEVTALFADLVGFTAMSESTPPTVLVRILNGYFERMSQGDHQPPRLCVHVHRRWHPRPLRRDGAESVAGKRCRPRGARHAPRSHGLQRRARCRGASRADAGDRAAAWDRRRWVGRQPAAEKSSPS